MFVAMFSSCRVTDATQDMTEGREKNGGAAVSTTLSLQWKRRNSNTSSEGECKGVPQHGDTCRHRTQCVIITHMSE